MADIKISNLNQINSVLNAMSANSGSSRLDNHYFQSNEISIDDLQDKAFKKNVLVTIVNTYGNIYKLTFLIALT